MKDENNIKMRKKSTIYEMIGFSVMFFLVITQSLLVSIEGTPLAPISPILYSPSDGAVFSDIAPTLIWNEFETTTNYWIQIDDDTDFSAPLIAENFTTLNYINYSSLSPSTYYWRVAAYDGGWSTWSVTWAFTIDTTPPSPPTLLLPSNGDESYVTTPTLDWEASSGANLYNIEVDDNADFSSVIYTHDTADTEYQIPISLSDNTYFWRVKARDEAENWGAWSSEFSLMIDTVPPGSPALINPSNGEMSNENMPYMSWTAVSSASSYQLQIDNDYLMTSLEIAITTTDTFYQILSSLSDAGYYWRVRAKDAAGNLGAWASRHYFVIDTENPTEIPTLDFPSNGDALTDNTPYLEWDYMSGIYKYWVQVDNNNDFSSPVVNQTTYNPEYPITTVLSDTTYYWRVCVVDEAGNNGTWSSSWYFTIDTTGTDAPILQFPGDGEQLNENDMDNGDCPFSWSSVVDAVLYNIEVAYSATFVSMAFNVTTPSTSYSQSLSSAILYWRVKSRDALDNWGDWSDVWSFDLDRVSPDPPILTFPVDLMEPLRDNTPLFQWDSIGDAVNYQIRAYETVGIYVIDELVASNYFQTIIPLPDAEYTWEVRAFDAAGNDGLWCAAKIVEIDTTGPAAPIFTAPTDGGLSSVSSFLFEWTNVADTHQYLLQLDKNSPDFTNLVVNETSSSAVTDYGDVFSDGTYYARVRATDLPGNWGEWSEILTITVDTISPNSPSVVNPSNEMTYVLLQPLLEWESLPDAEEYQLQVDNVNNSFSALYLETTTSEVDYQFPFDLAVDTYYWRVRARDYAGNWGDWSAVFAFTIANPTLLTIINDDFSSNARPSLDWTSLSGSIAYDLQIASSYFFVSGLYVDTSLTVSEYRPPVALPDGTYYWRVRARDIEGNIGDWSETGSFTIDTVLPEIETQEDIAFTEGDIGNSIRWHLTDTNPVNYSIYENGIIIGADTWESGEEIIIDLDVLSIGTYTYTLIVVDAAQNFAGDSVIVTVTSDSTGSTDPTDPSDPSSGIAGLPLGGIIGLSSIIVPISLIIFRKQKRRRSSL